MEPQQTTQQFPKRSESRYRAVQIRRALAADDALRLAELFLQSSDPQIREAGEIMSEIAQTLRRYREVS